MIRATSGWIEKFAVGIVAIYAAMAVVPVLTREFRHRKPQAPRPVLVKDWQKYAAGDERLGSPRAPLRLVVFSDFECPFCRQLSISLDQLVKKRPAEVEVIHRNFPLSAIHPYARRAAIAGECATKQGRFAAFYRFAFAHQDSLGALDWPRVAKRIGVRDTSLFQECLSNGSVLPTLRADSVAAESLGITGTPMLLVNDWKVQGNPGPVELARLISRASRETESR